MSLSTIRRREWALILIAPFVTSPARPSADARKLPIVSEVRAAVAARDLATAAKLLLSERQSAGVSPEWLEAESWLSRGYLAAKNYENAERSAEETRKLALELLRGRRLDAEPSLPIAVGASIEVQAQVLNLRGQKAEAVAFLQQELKAWHNTSIRARIQKNLHLISLQGRPAPPLDVHAFIGAQPPSLASLRGRKVLLFFWAHWCGECKSQGAVLARIAREFPNVAILGPTQTYGFAAGGESVPRAIELRYIGEVWEKYYRTITGMTVPVSEENFKEWGASTTPTVVALDAAGAVRLYHPGRMTYEELLPYVRD